MWKKFATDYLSFSRKDRVAVIVLLVLIFLVVFLPALWPVKKAKPLDNQELEKIKRQVAQLKTKGIDSLTEAMEEPAGRPVYSTQKNSYRIKANLFFFDPNTLDKNGWQQLGIREKTAATIVNYRTKGGRFRKREDLGKIYGLFKDDYERLLPWVRIAAEDAPAKEFTEKKREYDHNATILYPAKKFAPAKTIEINAADTTAFILLPGIGSKLAARIINFRQRLGGFYATDQVAETYGLPDSTFNKIKNVLQCSAIVQQININTADANMLKQHPYIRWNLANAIVQYRAQHGNFSSVDDLQLIALITPEIFQKLKPYLVL